MAPDLAHLRREGKPVWMFRGRRVIEDELREIRLYGTFWTPKGQDLYSVRSHWRLLSRMLS